MIDNQNLGKDQLREIFTRFNPRMTGEADFIARLESKLSAIEEVKEMNSARCAHMKKAVGIAVFFGFIIGVVLTLSFNLIMSGIASLLDSLSPTLSTASMTVSWIVISVVTIVSAGAAYDLSLSPGIQSKVR